MPTTLREATRTARKPHRCDLCDGLIAVGEQHHVSTNVYDGRVYDWRTCAACKRDRVIAYVYDWAGFPDEGVGYDTALEWAADAESWPESDEKAAALAFTRRRMTTREVRALSQTDDRVEESK